MKDNLEVKAVAVIKQFNAKYPKVKVGLKERHETYVLTLDYSFTNLNFDEQAEGREGLNTLMYALQGIGLPVHLEMGYV